MMFPSRSNSFSPPGKLPGSNDGDFISPATDCGWARGQGFLNNSKPNTASDYAAIAELKPVMEGITPDVRNLGIVPGFNSPSK